MTRPIGDTDSTAAVDTADLLAVFPRRTSPSVTPGPPVSQAVADVVSAVIPAERRLPALPAAGQRDNKIPKFSGDVLGWEADAGGGALAFGRVEVNPGRIVNAADLDGTYQCIVSLTDAEVSRLSGAGVNYLEIWFGVETVHVVSPWAPALATRIDAIVDATEETQIGAVGDLLPVRAVYRINAGGGQTYYGEGAGALRVGGFDVTAAERTARQRGDTFTVYTVQDATTLNAALRLHASSDNASIFYVNAVWTTAVRTYTTEERYYLAPHHSTEGQMVQIANAPRGGESSFAPSKANLYGAVKAIFHPSTNAGVTADDANNELDVSGGAGALTTAQQIALLTFVPDPGGITFASVAELSAKVRLIRIGIPNPELLTGDVWVAGEVQGQPSTLGRVKWASTTAILEIRLATLNSDAVASALITDGDPDVEVNLRFYDAATAGNEIERIALNIPLVDQRGIPDNIPDAPAQGATAKIYGLSVPPAPGPRVWGEIDVSGGGSSEADTTIGGALAGTGGSTWNSYTITEDIEGERWYRFLMQVGTSPGLVMPTSAFKGQDFLDLSATADGATFAQGIGNSILGVASPRPNADGVRTFFLARTATARRMLVRSGDDAVHRIVRLDKLGGIRGPAGPRGTFDPQLVRSASYNLNNVGCIDLGFDWPSDSQFLIASAPHGSSVPARSEGGVIIPNPRFRRLLADTKPVTAREVGDDLSANNDYAVGFDSRGAIILLGRTNAQRALGQVSQATADPAPLTIMKL